MFKGTFTAIITPFKDEYIDYDSFSALIEEQINGGVDGIVFLGTTGESPSISPNEYKKIIDFAVKTVNKRVFVIIGTGTNNTEGTVERTNIAKDGGADGVLVVSPYYNKPCQAGLYRHFEAIATTVDIPLILYNIQSRTGVNISVDTIVRLSKLKNVVAIKEASGNLAQMMEIINLTDEHFTILSGDDILTFPLMVLGGHGVISVASNIIPDKISELVKSILTGKITNAKEIHYKYLELIKVLFIVTNPVPVKEALAMIDKCSNRLRLPLCNMCSEDSATIRDTLKKYSLL